MWVHYHCVRRWEIWCILAFSTCVICLYFVCNKLCPLLDADEGNRLMTGFACVSSHELALMLVYLNCWEMTSLRLVSRKLRAAVDSDQVWSTFVRERCCDPSGLLLTVVPNTHGQWKRFAINSGVFRLASHQVPDRDQCAMGIATWIPLVSTGIQAPPSSGRRVLQFNSPVRELGDVVCPPRILNESSMTGRLNRSTSIGLVLAETASERIEAEIFDTVHSQLCRFFNLVTADRFTRSAVHDLRQQNGAEGPQLSVFTYFPRGPDGDQVMVSLLRHQGIISEAHSGASGGAGECAYFAKLLEVVFATSSHVIFLGDSSDSISTSLSRLVGPHMSRGDRAAYSTDENTPNVLFAGRSRLDVPQLISNIPPNLAAWVTQRSSCIGDCMLEHDTLFTMRKPYRVPAWINPAVSVDVPVSVILRMIESAIKDLTSPPTPLPNGNATSSAHQQLWTAPVVSFLCSAQERQSVLFYARALDTDFDEMTRPTPSDGLDCSVRVPAEPSQLVAIHHQHFYSALRNHCMVLPPVCGADSDIGLAALENLKRRISDKFRDVWVENREVSRDYCSAQFQHVFSPVISKFLIGDDPIGFQHKRGLKQFYSAMQDKMLEYKLKSKGHRRFDILSEKVSEAIIPLLYSYCDEHPDHPYFRRDDAEAVARELVADCHRMMSDFARQVDVEFGQLQRTTAVYTASLGSEWAASLQTQAMTYLHRREDEANAWCFACAARSGFLLRHNTSRSGVLHLRPYSESQNELSEEPVSDVETRSNTAVDESDADAAMATENPDNDDSDELMRVQREHVRTTARAVEQDLRAAAARLASNLRGSETAAFTVVAREGCAAEPSRAKRIFQTIRRKIASL